MTDPATQLLRFLADELSRPVAPAITTFAAELAARGGTGVAGVLFYGSALRTGATDGLLDFYVLLDRLEDWDATPAKRFGNRLLPPNVEYAETTAAGMTLRAKLAVMTLEQFHRHARAKSRDTTIWARFAQPAGLVFARDAASAEAVAEAVARAARAAAWWAAHLGPERGSAAAFWSALFSQTYASELRVEGASRPGSIVDAAPERYDAILRLAWAAEGILFSRHEIGSPETSAVMPDGSRASTTFWGDGSDGSRGYPREGAGMTAGSGNGALEPRISERARADAQRAWRRRSRLAKPLNLARLAKAAFTFSGGADYVAWKIERHSGHRIEITPFQRRHPLLGAGPLLWRLWRKGVLR